MYSPKVIAKRAKEVESNFPIKLKEHSLDEVDRWVAQINSALTPQSTIDSPVLARALTPEEKTFITNERFMTRISYPYWVTRYGWIKPDKGGETRVKFWESQEMLMEIIGMLEEMGKPILLLNLKARQVGASTICETILGHKCMTLFGFNSLIAADEPNQSAYLFNMFLRLFDRLPFWLRPHVLHRVKGTELLFDELDSAVFVESGNKRVGGIGQGKTIHSGHLSEMATWNNPSMISEDLIPAILSGASPNTFFIMESTAKGYNHWRDWWVAAKRGRFHGFRNIFIPWWALKNKYADDPETGWTPTEEVKLVQANLKAQGIEITRKQMYWWDRTYLSYKEENRLNAFYAEYAGSDEEAFQLSGRSIFPIDRIQQLRQNALLATRVNAAPYIVQNKTGIL